ncbi:MAG: Mth938-like domain-containing protein [Pseudoxanthomonas sp.]
MQLNHERPDYAYALRAADGSSAKVNDRVLEASFILAPDALIEDWEIADSAALSPDDMAPLLALSPELILLGTGDRQIFPSAAVMAACLTRGVGIEVMANAAAARTFNVLAGEGRRVVLGMQLPDRNR